MRLQRAFETAQNEKRNVKNGIKIENFQFEKSDRSR